MKPNYGSLQGEGAVGKWQRFRATSLPSCTRPENTTLALTMTVPKKTQVALAVPGR